MSFEENRKPNQDRNQEVYVGADTEFTVPAAMFMGTPLENSRDYGLDVPSYLKLIVEKPCEQRGESAVMIFEADPKVSDGMPSSMYMLSQDDLISETGVGLSADDLERVAQWIPADGTEVSGPTKDSFRVKSNEQGDIIIKGCSESGTLLKVKVPGSGQE